MCGQAGLGLLLADALLLKGGLGLPVLVFWVAIAAINVSILGQAVIWWERGPALPALLQVTALQTSLSLLAVWSAPHGLLCCDAHFDYNVALRVVGEGYPLAQVGLLPRTIGYSHWPGLHLLAGSVSALAGVPLLEMARYLPVALTASTPPLIFLALRRASGSPGPALLATLLVTEVPWATTTHSQFIRETAAFPLFLATAAFLGRGEARAAFLCTFAALFAHHLASALTVLLWPAWLATGLFLRWPRSRLLPYATASAILATVWAGWVILSPEPARRAVFESLAQIRHGVESLLRWQLASPFTSIPREADIPRQISTYGKQVLGGAMAAVAGVWLVRRLCRRQAQGEEAALAAIGLGISGWMFLSHYVAAFAGALNPARLAAFGLWPVADRFAVAVGGAPLPGRLGRATAALAVAALIAVFIVELPTDFYRPDRQPTYRWGMVRWGQTQELYAAAAWQAAHLPAGRRLAGDAPTLEVLGGLYQRVVALDARFYWNGGREGQWDGFVLRQEMRRLAYFSWTRQEGYRFFPLDDQRWRQLLYNPAYDLAYDNGDVQLLVRRR
jgi:hypothetical protein